MPLPGKIVLLEKEIGTVKSVSFAGKAMGTDSVVLLGVNTIS
jgi:hypothetical protein